MKISLSTREKNALFLFIAFAFPFAVLAITVTFDVMQDFYISLTGFWPLVLYYCWGSWLAVAFTSFNKIGKLIALVVLTLPMSYLLFFISWIVRRQINLDKRRFKIRESFGSLFAF